MKKKLIDRVIDIVFITILITGMIFSAIFAIVLTVTGINSAEAEGMAITLVVPVLVGATMIPMLIDDYKDHCKSSEEDQ